MVLRTVFSILATFISIYSILCTIRIVLTWIPGLSNGFTIFLEKICDPYLRFFSKKMLLVFGQFDFSPMLALGILAILTTLFNGLAVSAKIGLSTILILILNTVLYTAMSIVFFFLIFAVIRFIALLLQKDSNKPSPFWQKFDYIFSPFFYKVSRFFSGGKMISYKAAVLITILFFIFIAIISFLVINQITFWISFIPF